MLYVTTKNWKQSQGYNIRGTCYYVIQVLFITSENTLCNINGSKVTRYQNVYIIISNTLKKIKRSRNYIKICIVDLFSHGVMSDYYFLKFTDLPLGILCFYNRMGKNSKTIKSIGSASHKYWFSYWAKGSFTTWDAFIFPCASLHRRKKHASLLFMDTGQDNAPLNLSWDNDHYLLGDLERDWVSVTLSMFYHGSIRRNLPSYP